MGQTDTALQFDLPLRRGYSSISHFCFARATGAIFSLVELPSAQWYFTLTKFSIRRILQKKKKSQFTWWRHTLPLFTLWKLPLDKSLEVIILCLTDKHFICAQQFEAWIEADQQSPNFHCNTQNFLCLKEVRSHKLLESFRLIMYLLLLACLWKN